MDSLPTEVLQLVAVYALPTESSSSSTNQPVPSVVSVRRSMRWVAELRRINRHWKMTLDEKNFSLWFHVAEALGFGRTRQLYAGGTHRDVCKLILDAEHQKNEAEADVALRVAQGKIGMSQDLHDGLDSSFPSRPRRRHPRPERPRVMLPSELNERVSKNAMAFKSFLRSVKLIVLGRHVYEKWHESALNRYRMFLQLKRANPSIWLVPTLDIQFCWLSHIFRTEAYRRDVTALGISPEHSLCLASYGEVATFSEAVRGTAYLWNEAYGEKFPYLRPGTTLKHLRTIWRVENNARVCRIDPRRFFPAMGPEILQCPPEMPTVSLKCEEIRADLVWFSSLESAFTRMSLHSQAARRGRDPDICRLFTDQVLPSYQRFLNFCKEMNMSLDEPPNVLHLVWLAHQTEPVRYKEDCLLLFGREFMFNPWPNGLGVYTPVASDLEMKWTEMYGTRMRRDWQYV